MNRLEGRFAAQQIPGGREYQEDDYGLIERGDPDIDGSEVLLLADGMGGHVSGDTASRTVVKTFVETYHSTDGPITDRLRACLTVANDALSEATTENPELKGMGATVVAAVVSQHGLDWISVGDSPLWLFRDGKLRRLNADHSMAPVLANLVAARRMTEEEAATDPKRHALRSAVMGDEIHLIDVSSQPVAVRKSDRLLLASDGLMTLEDEEIVRILKNKSDASLEEVAEALIHAVEEAGHPNQDNTTVLLYIPEADYGGKTLPDDIDQKESEQRDETQQSKRKTGLSVLWSGSKQLSWSTILIGILLCGLLIAFGLIAYWFKLRLHEQKAEVKTTPVQQMEPPRQDVSSPPTSTETRPSDLPEEQTETHSSQADSIAKDISPLIASPAQRDTSKVSGESP